jgi:hypothetical protein
MSSEERKYFIAQYSLQLAASKTLLRNLDGLLSEAEIDDYLDRISTLTKLIEALKKGE